MKRNVFFTLLLASLVLILVACSNSEEKRKHLHKVIVAQVKIHLEV